MNDQNKYDLTMMPFHTKIDNYNYQISDVMLMMLLSQGSEEWVLLESMVLEMRAHQYILAICSVLEMKMKHISVMEMNSQLVALTIMMFQ